MDTKKHWENRYETTEAEKLTWYQSKPSVSLGLIEKSCTPQEALLDVGAGASTLVDHLLERGFTDVTLLDLSESALNTTRSRLGARGEQVNFIATDITSWEPAQQYSLWHDRAVFHFLTESQDREAYKLALLSGLKPGGTLVMGTFAIGGPEKCSGLPIRQYDQARLEEFLGPDFVCQGTQLEEHPTPAGNTQLFHVASFQRKS